MAPPGQSPTFDHLGLLCPAAIFEDEISFLTAALAPLDIKEHFRMMPLVSAMGNDTRKPDFWISGLGPDRQPLQGEVSRVHVAFRAKDRNQVDAFHAAGVQSGGKDNGAPGIRDHYHKGYYAAFVISPAGHTFEVVFHDWELAGME